MELINVNRIGVTKGTAVEEAVMANFKGRVGRSGALPRHGT